MNAKSIIQRAVIVISALLLFVTVQAQEDESWLPIPTGPYQIGTSSYHWVDETREEMFTDELDDRRELVVRIWYPAALQAGTDSMTYFPNGDIEVSGFEISQAIGPFAGQVSAEQLANTPTQSYVDAPISDAETNYPVLIYSPGTPGMPEFATAHIQELVSYGYIVVGINHPYFSGWTVFPDGRMVTSNLFEKVQADATQMELSVEIAAQDQVYVLNQLARLNEAGSGDPLSGYLDLDRVGTFGTSWGAWVAAVASLDDSQISVLLVEGPHGFLPDMVIEEGLDLPIMFMDPATEPSTEVYLQLTGPAYRLNMDEISGWSYGDFPLWPGFPEQELADVSASRAVQVINTYALAFFDHYLKGEDQILLQGPSDDFPEVDIQSRNLDR